MITQSATGTSIAAVQAVLQGLAIEITLPPYNATGNGLTVTDGAMSSVTNPTTLTCSTSQPFKATDVGKLVNVWGAGAAGVSLSGTITAYISPSQVTLSVAAATTVAGATVTFGTDDTAAFTQALSDATGKGGGTIKVPQVPGTYCVNALVDVPDDVWFQGGGRTGTRITWMSDLGAASPGIRSGPNTKTVPGQPTGSNYCLISDLELVGPGTQTIARGLAPAQMQGVALRSNGRLSRSNTYGWNAGIVFNGNHEKVDDCKSSANFAGIAWLPPADGTYGNQAIYDTEAVGNLYCGYYVHGDNKIDSCCFVNAHNGFQPHGIVKDNNGTYSQGFLSATDLINYSFESIGNMLIWDKGKAKDIRGIHFHGPGANSPFNPTYNYATDASAYGVVAHTWLDSDVWGVGAFQNGQASGFFDVDTAANLIFHQAANMIANSSNTVPLFKAANSCTAVYLYNANGLRCRMAKIAGSVTDPGQYNVLYMGTSGTYSAAVDTAASGGSDIPVGVLQIAANRGTWGVLGIEGPSLVSMQAAMTGPAYVSADTTNRGKAKAGAVSDGGIIIGRADDTGNPATVILTIGG